MNAKQLKILSEKAVAAALCWLILSFCLPTSVFSSLAGSSTSSSAAPHLLTLIFSLIMVINFWLAQEKLMHLHGQVSKSLLLLNVLYFIALIIFPVTARIYSIAPLSKPNLLVYIGSVFFISIIYTLLFYLVIQKKYTEHQTLSQKIILKLKRRVWIGPVFIVSAAALSYLNIFLAIPGLLLAGYFFMSFPYKLKFRKRMRIKSVFNPARN